MKDFETIIAGGCSKICFTLAFLVFVVFCKTNCFSQDREKTWNISDNDTVYLDVKEAVYMYGIPGSVFKAVDPEYIANRNGFTKQLIRSKEKKFFEVISFYECDDDNMAERKRNLNAINSARLWNYYINDKFMNYYSRILVSTLKLHAIDKVEYVAEDTLHYVIDGHPIRMTELPDKNKYVAAVRISVRDAAKATIPNESTLYLLNDTIITRKIFDALNPVYIRSLQRITDNRQLAKYGKRNISEVVLIETFKSSEIIAPDWVRFDDRTDKDEVLLVDEIQLPVCTEDVFNEHFFRKKFHYSFMELPEELQVLQEKYPDKKRATVISIE